MASSLWLMWQAAPLLKKLMSNFLRYILGYKRYKAQLGLSQLYSHFECLFSFNLIHLLVFEDGNIIAVTSAATN